MEYPHQERKSILLDEIRNLREEDKTNLRATGGEGAWIGRLAIDKKMSTPLFSLVDHSEIHLKNGTFIDMPLLNIVYQTKKDTKAFVKNNSIKIHIGSFEADNTIVITVSFVVMDNPKNPLVLECYFNPFYQDEDEPYSILRDLEDLKLIAESSIILICGYHWNVRKDEYDFEGMSFAEFTPEFKAECNKIVERLLKTPEKRQTKEQFLKVKSQYQKQTPLDFRKINWLGDWRKIVLFREFMSTPGDGKE